MNLEEKTINEKLIYESSFLSFKVEDVLLPNGSTSKRAIVVHPGASVIVPIDENQNVIMVKQFRKPLNKVILELPAGKLDDGEDPLNCAKRELEEETGYTSEQLIKLTEIYTTPGFSNEVIHVFLASNLKEGNTNTDVDEFVEVIKLPLKKVVEMVMNGEIKDAKTIIGLLLAEKYFKSDSK
ncbi:NUDIX domain-containing protein [Caldicellulosiruptoraceae bacterium PP1]